MKKLLLPILMMGVFIVMSGVVSAAYFTSPSETEVITADTYVVSWENEGASTLDLQYKIGACTPTGDWQDLNGGVPFGVGTETYTWDIAVDGVADGLEYCLRLNEGSSYNYSGVFTIDRVRPVCPAGFPAGFSTPAFADTAVGLETLFTSTASIADLSPLTFEWEFRKGTSVENDAGNPVTHTFDNSGFYTVTVVVKDAEYDASGYSCFSTMNIDVKSPVILPEQEVVALTNLVTDFGTTYDSGLADNGFLHPEVAGVSTCTKMLTDPVAMTTVENGAGDECIVTWNAVPNADQGTDNPMFVRVTNGGTIAYYYFNTIVYSWKIDLVEGWNLISIPLIPIDPSNGEVTTDTNYVFDTIVDSVAYEGSSAYTIYQAGTSYKTRPLADRSGFYDSTLDDIVPGYAYWIKMDVADSLYGFGDKIGSAPFGYIPTVELVSGWNWIGKFGLTSVALANEIDNLVFDGESDLKDLANYQVNDENANDMTGGNLDPGRGYLAFLGGNNGESIIYTKSIADYIFA